MRKRDMHVTGTIFDLLMKGTFIGLGVLAVAFSAYEWMWIQ